MAEEADADRPVRRMSKQLSRETDTEFAAPTGDDCVICLSAIVETCVRTPCDHYFHQECLEQYLAAKQKERGCDRFARHARCPVCRGSMREPLAVEARATSGLRIEVTSIPSVGDYCHFDRAYAFESLGGFDRPDMLYVVTSNDDRKTPSTEVMWIIEASVPVTVHLNFRSEGHARGPPGVAAWLKAAGWRRNDTLQSAVTTGFPNGPYSGPVFSRECGPGRIELMGSNNWEGVYFVFVEIKETRHTVIGQPVEVAGDATTVEGLPVALHRALSDRGRGQPGVVPVRTRGGRRHTVGNTARGGERRQSSSDGGSSSEGSGSARSVSQTPSRTSVGSAQRATSTSSRAVESSPAHEPSEVNTERASTSSSNTRTTLPQLFARRFLEPPQGSTSQRRMFGLSGRARLPFFHRPG